MKGMRYLFWLDRSYLWVKTVSDQNNAQGQFAVPNYLTGRRFNVRLSVKF